MKKQVCYLIVVSCFTVLSCTYKDLNPETGYIKANVNGWKRFIRQKPQTWISTIIT